MDPSGEALLFHSDRAGQGRLFELELPWKADGEPRQIALPTDGLRSDADVMHPTRARNGVLSFDVSYEEGSAPTRWLRRKRARILSLRARLQAWKER